MVGGALTERNMNAQKMLCCVPGVINVGEVLLECARM